MKKGVHMDPLPLPAGRALDWYTRGTLNLALSVPEPNAG
jgi:hypothetical protein